MSTAVENRLIPHRHNPPRKRGRTSFQVHLDSIETKTAKTPNQLLALAAERGYNPTTKARSSSTGCATTSRLGRGHAMAFCHLLQNGATISDRHVGTTGSHRDESTQLRPGRTGSTRLLNGDRQTIAGGRRRHSVRNKSTDSNDGSADSVLMRP